MRASWRLQSRGVTVPVRVASARAKGPAARSRPPLRITIALLTISLLIVVASGAPLITPFDPNASALLQRLQPPAFAGGSWTHPLGTDHLGRDVLARSLYGARVSLLVAGVATVLGLVVGTLLGLVAAVRPGSMADHAVTYLIDVQLSLPFILLAIAVALVLGTSLPVLVALAALATWPGYARVVRAVALSLREREFVMAARALGASEARVMLRHLLPNLAAPLTVLATLSVGSIVLFESALSFIGIGIRPPTPSWGVMIADGREYLSRAWWLSIVPSAFLVALTLAVGVLGDALRDRLDVKSST